MAQTATAPNRDLLGIRARFGTARGLVRLLLAEAEHRAGRLAEFHAIDWKRVDRLVFVCAGNICRSPYGERRARMSGLPAASLGLSTHCGQPANQWAAMTARKRGVDLSGHASCDTASFEFRDGDLLLGMEVRHVREMRRRFGGLPCQIGLLGLWSTPRRAHIHDPFSLDAAYFDTCFAVIDSAVEGLARRMGARGGDV